MPIIKNEIRIDAPIEVCFDLARDVEIHTKTVGETNERAIKGVTSGHLKLGDKVTWEAVHFGVKQQLTAKIVEMEEPYIFVDEMVMGVFHSFRHTHKFIEDNGHTIMIDIFEYKSPLGVVGKIADMLFLEAYMTKFISSRCDELKKIAERMGNTR